MSLTGPSAQTARNNGRSQSELAAGERTAGNRLADALCSLLSGLVPDAGLTRSDMLEGRLRELESILAERDAELSSLRLECESLSSRLKIAQVEIQGLADVIARDRARVQSETASYHAQGAIISGGPRLPGQ